MSLSNKYTLNGPVALLAAGILLLLAGVATFIIVGDGTPEKSVSIENSGEVARVSLREAITAYESSSAVFVDVRSAGSFATSNIPGSLFIPINDILERSAELDPEDWVITICA